MLAVASALLCGGLVYSARVSEEPHEARVLRSCKYLPRVGSCHCIDTLERVARPDTLDWEAELAGPGVPIRVSDCSSRCCFLRADIDEQQLIVLRVHGQIPGVHAPVEVEQASGQTNLYRAIVFKLEPAGKLCELDV